MTAVPGVSDPRLPAAAILAGGRASRMGGRSKPTIAVEGRRIVDRQLDVLSPMVPGRFAELLVVTSDPAPFAGLGLRVVPDVVPGLGPLVGILSALLATTAPAVVAIGCDMPYLSPDLLRLLADPTATADVVVPVLRGFPEPLLARWGRVCVGPIRARLARGELRAAGVMADVRVREVSEAELRAVDPELRSFVNVNTPEDVR